MPSSLLSDASLNIFNASSTHYTLKVMTYVAVVLTPIVLIYQGWTYWIFRKRINPNQIASADSGVLDVVH
jgi:cytochrome d ubiquinol oxidase subunit II